MNTCRNRYHTSIKLSYKMDLLPPETVKMIPKSTLHRFKYSDYSNIFGIELAEALERNELIIKELLHCKAALNASRGIIKIKNTIIKIRESALSGFQKIKEVVSVINDTKDSIGLDAACGHFNISRSTFHSWQFQVRHYCYDSFAGKCLRRWPGQLSVASVEKIRSLCEDEQFKGWPAVSIAHYARRSGLLSISVYTWYKYAKLIGIFSRPPRCLKKQRTGIRAVMPHQFWHADVTLFRTMDNVRAYIYLVVDNYSRAILSWRVSLKLCAETRLDTVREAYDNHIHDSSADVQLIVDGGSENNNSVVDEYIGSPGISIKKIIAQQDILFSNSMVEAVNKIVKYRSLFLDNIPNIHALQKHMEKFVPVYNDVRPHCSLKGLTPSEVLAGLRPDNPEHLKSVNLRREKTEKVLKQEIKCTVCSEK
ncbi:MAG TPA: integrase core domain-containing protein [Spirochaetota bacterium]|nr:integrase core domain-containing protein [Spirochaetota bacterium]